MALVSACQSFILVTLLPSKPYQTCFQVYNIATFNEERHLHHAVKINASNLGRFDKTMPKTIRGGLRGPTKVNGTGPALVAYLGNNQ